MMKSNVFIVDVYFQCLVGAIKLLFVKNTIILPLHSIKFSLVFAIPYAVWNFFCSSFIYVFLYFIIFQSFINFLRILVLIVLKGFEFKCYYKYYSHQHRVPYIYI